MEAWGMLSKNCLSANTTVPSSPTLKFISATWCCRLLAHCFFRGCCITLWSFAFLYSSGTDTSHVIATLTRTKLLLPIAVTVRFLFNTSIILQTAPTSLSASILFALSFLAPLTYFHFVLPLTHTVWYTGAWMGAFYTHIFFSFLMERGARWPGSIL